MYACAARSWFVRKTFRSPIVPASVSTCVFNFSAEMATGCMTRFPRQMHLHMYKPAPAPSATIANNMTKRRRIDFFSAKRIAMASGSRFQHRHTLDVGGLREHVERLDFLQRVRRLTEFPQIARERGGIAGHVDQMLRLRENK